MSLIKGLTSGFSSAHSTHVKTYLGNASTTEFKATVEASGVAKVEAWVSNAWLERALKDPNDGSPGATQYTFVNPSNDTITVKYGTAPAAPIAQVDTVQFVAKASLEDGEFLVLSAKDGTKYGVLLDVSGEYTAETKTQTNAAWTAIASAKKAICDLSGAIVTDEEVAAAVKTSLDGITDIETKLTLSVLTHTITATQVTAGECVAPVSYEYGATVNLTIAQTAKGITNCSRITFEQGSSTLVKGLTNGL